MSGHEHDEHTHAEHVHNEHAGHVHTENCGCADVDREIPGEIHVECHLHDEARVISASLLLFADYDKLKAVLSEQLKILSKTVQECGGIVGHIKAAVETKVVDMFSITDVDVTVKTAPEKEIKINLASIVFLIEPDTAEMLVINALETVRDCAGL